MNMRADAHITPEVFARTLCDDLILPYNPFQREISAQINAQLEDSRRIAYKDNIVSQRPVEEEHDDEMEETKDELFWARWRKRLRREDGQAVEMEEEKPEVDTEPTVHEDLRIVIKVRRAAAFGTLQKGGLMVRSSTSRTAP